MLRIILWKLGFEWAQLVRLISPRNDRKVYYFAFGANLSHKVLQQRSIRVFDAFDHALDDALVQAQVFQLLEHGRPVGLDAICVLVEPPATKNHASVSPRNFL